MGPEVQIWANLNLISNMDNKKQFTSKMHFYTKKRVYAKTFLCQKMHFGHISA